MDETLPLHLLQTPLFLAKFTEAVFAEEKFCAERNICIKCKGN